VLTSEPYGVRDFTIDPASRWIVYSAWRSDGGSDLWYLAPGETSPSRLLACRQSACSSPIWLPDMSHLIYLLQYTPRPGGAASGSTIWTLDTTTGATHALPTQDNGFGANPQLSPDGHWLAYDTLTSQVLRILSLDRMQSVDVADTIGGLKAWRPDSGALVMTGVVQGDGQDHNGLLSIDPASGNHVNLADSPTTNDRTPVWSPDGQVLAFVRSAQGAGTNSAGQIWLVNRDGSNAHALVSGQPYAFDALGWSPDGHTLLAEARLLIGAQTNPSLWRIDVSTGEITPLVRVGYLAAWVS